MPLKYYWGMPIYVKVVGMTHGILFTLYCLQLFLAMRRHKWGLGYAAYLFVAALIPFGTFYTDRRLREMAAAQGGRVA
jgi:integral membrane protein